MFRIVGGEFFVLVLRVCPRCVALRCALVPCLQDFDDELLIRVCVMLCWRNAEDPGRESRCDQGSIELCC